MGLLCYRTRHSTENYPQIDHWMSHILWTLLSLQSIKDGCLVISEEDRIQNLLGKWLLSWSDIATGIRSLSRICLVRSRWKAWDIFIAFFHFFHKWAQVESLYFVSTKKYSTKKSEFLSKTTLTVTKYRKIEKSTNKKILT